MTATHHARTAWLCMAIAALFAQGCGLEALFFVRKFEATPPPHAVIKGNVGGLPSALADRVGGTQLTVRAVAVDGRVLASTGANVGGGFTLNLPPNLGDQFNVRILAGAGTVQLRAMAPEVLDGEGSDNRETSVGEIGLRSTAAQLLAEAYSATARSGLAGTPPSVARKVMENGSDTNTPEVAAFHAVVEQVMGAMEPSRGTAPFADDGTTPAESLLAAATLPRAQWDAALAAAVAVVGVPVVCDPSRIRVMITVDISGQALDGNGKRQFIRQLPKEGRVFLGITLDPSSPIPDAARSLKPRLMPNDVDTEMFDDGTHGDEVAGDQVFTITLVLPRGMRVIYKFTDGSPGEGYTGTEEWPGNARILQVEDVLTSDPTGKPDCLVIRRDSFGDESSNKNFVNLHASLAGGSMQFGTDLGGVALMTPADPELLPVAGLAVDGLSAQAPLTPAGVPEARENGACQQCPPPVTVPVDDNTVPGVVTARFSSTEQVAILFTEDLDLGSAANRGNYLMVDELDGAIPVRRIEVSGALVTLGTDPVDPRKAYRVFIQDVADASQQRNVLPPNPRGYNIQGDTVAPTLVDAAGSTITEVNPAARPANPTGGEVVVLNFSEVLDRISAENVSAYALSGPQGGMPVYAAYQRGKSVLLVTDGLQGGAEHVVTVNGVFDVAGNVIGADSSATLLGLTLHRVTVRAVPGHAWTSIDGAQRGLPAGDGLYITGTITQAARAADGADIRVSGRPDVAGRQGFELLPSTESVSGKPVYAVDLLLPTGTYALKFAHGVPRDAVAPPATLETVTKALCTTNDATGVQVNPITMVGEDGLSYAGARLSLGGDDAPGPGVLFKRENPDVVVNVAGGDVVTPAYIIGTWRDVPFGRGRDYDDGKRDLGLIADGQQDVSGPLPIAAEARDSESVLLSFNKAISTQPTDLQATVTDEEGVPLSASVLAVGIPGPTQAVLRTGPMALNRGYTVLVTRAADVAAHVATDPRTVAFTSPGAFTPFTPVVDTDPPAVVSVLASGPTTLQVRFTERVAATAAEAAHYQIDLAAGGSGPAVISGRITDAGRSVLLTTEPQQALAAYVLQVSTVDDRATPPNQLASQQVAFEGFGDSTPPQLLDARAVTPTQILLRFNEPLDAASASSVANYAITSQGGGGLGGLAVAAALASHSADVALGAFNADWAPLRTDLVVLTLADAMQPTRAYTVTATSVLDRVGNPSAATADFMGISEAPRVTVDVRYLISATAQVVGIGSGGAAGVPPRAVAPSRLATEREGLFILGTALTIDGASPVSSHPMTAGLGGFPDEGAPLDGVEPQLRDDGMGGDETAGDNIYTLRVTNVPLGSVVSYKAFASYSTAYRDANPSDPLAAFADDPAGPRVFSDGQEYPGNDNAVWLLADLDGNGRVVLDNLFGDEISFKRKTGFRPFAWVVDTWRRQE